MPVVGVPTEFHGNYSFTVSIDQVPYAAFTEFSLPSLQVETMEIKEGGQNTYVHKLPIRVKPGSFVLKNGVTRNSMLLAWYLQILNGDMENAVRQVSVVMYDTLGDPVLTWNFRNAFPVKWSGPKFKADERSVAVEELEIVHHGFEVETYA